MLNIYSLPLGTSPLSLDLCTPTLSLTPSQFPLHLQMPSTGSVCICYPCTSILYPPTSPSETNCHCSGLQVVIWRRECDMQGSGKELVLRKGGDIGRCWDGSRMCRHGGGIMCNGKGSGLRCCNVGWCGALVLRRVAFLWMPFWKQQAGHFYLAESIPKLLHGPRPTTHLSPQ